MIDVPRNIEWGNEGKINELLNIFFRNPRL